MKSREDSTPRTELTATPSAPAARGAKRAYRRPAVVDYGNVRDITRGSSTKSFDYHSTTKQAAV
jgi:hypothetical protein